MKNILLALTIGLMFISCSCERVAGNNNYEQVMSDEEFYSSDNILTIYTQADIYYVDVVDFSIGMESNDWIIQCNDFIHLCQIVEDLTADDANAYGALVEPIVNTLSKHNVMVYTELDDILFDSDNYRYMVRGIDYWVDYPDYDSYTLAIENIYSYDNGDNYYR